MNRKHFLSSLLPFSFSFSTNNGQQGAVEGRRAEQAIRTPPYLKPGDRIGVTCPAGFILPEEIRSAVQRMEGWGLQVVTGTTVGKRDFTFGGTDEERKRDFQQMLDDRSLQAIMCARGGYGFVRIIDELDFSAFVRHPKWIIGFSDITVLHGHLNHNYGVASIHSKMCNSFPDDWSKAEPIQIETIDSIRHALMGEKMQYQVAVHGMNRTGTARGVLTGGNLKTIETLSGTKSDYVTAGKILFVEDTGEYLYSIDRMFCNLKRTGKLENLAALIVGGFKIKPDNEGEEFGRTVYDIVREKTGGYRYPVVFDFPVGHQKNNYALKCGVMHQLDVRTDGVLLRETGSNS
ncbi:MAG: LD-carboxypeptidase [Williamsia sp.]|nr:LD-carboxypeptidase [Williamsia sp.]